MKHTEMQQGKKYEILWRLSPRHRSLRLLVGSYLGAGEQAEPVIYISLRPQAGTQTLPIKCIESIRPVPYETKNRWR